jgi:amphi-Trp domain-containing protein
MPEVPAEESAEPTVETITDGYFEEEYYLSAEDAGAFLSNLGEQLAEGDEITISGEEWELPFAFGEPVTLEIEFEGDGESELEIEVEVSGRPDQDTPEIV